MNVLLLCSVVAVKGLVLFNVMLCCFLIFFCDSCLFACLHLIISSPFVCLLLLRRLDQVDD